MFHSFNEFNLCLVFWNLKPIEASVAFRVRVIFVVSNLLNRESVYLVPVTLQIKETQNWQPS